MDSNKRSRLQVGEVIAPFLVTTLTQGSLELPLRSAGALTHLQFRRFAGCPICNLHVRRFAAARERLEAEGVHPVAFFHSTEASMRPYQGDLPFPVVPDPERRWYRHFGVEQSRVSALHPRAMLAAVKGLASVPSNPFAGEGGAQGLPADFLLDATGRVLALHRGRHADDHWEVEDVLALARTARGQEARAS
ncbi:peroxiredoxin-like family protein [Myxococcus sp. MISCRS1]|uniref:peroxiredoxin-like family protein n=1 Tax=unclassified Myxococcus TaxID=2648731 RepID=UPI001CBB52A7|nr:MULTISPECIES: peroxiredoxin-like family protein [unclassified Myxococcus]MBZ4395190.1 AhpC/TSA family protein [Myxococcus sp. AS-1-15]MCY0999454.1 peroxiredoxin-like family protein [Myxococcus sp. MISCRS1]